MSAMHARDAGYRPRGLAGFPSEPGPADWERAARQLDELAVQADDPIVARGLHQAARDARAKAMPLPYRGKTTAETIEEAR